MAPVAALRACPLFKDFTHNGLQIIAEITEQRSFSKGAALFVENDALGEGISRGARFWQDGHISWRFARAFKPRFRPAQGVVTRWSSSSQMW
jgi:hypothetical protein